MVRLMQSLLLVEAELVKLIPPKRFLLTWVCETEQDTLRTRVVQLLQACILCCFVTRTISFFLTTATTLLKIKKVETFSRLQLIPKRFVSLFGTKWARTLLILKMTSPTRKCFIKTSFLVTLSLRVRSSLLPT